MENAGQKNCRWLIPGDRMPVVWQRGEGPRVIVEYLFPDLSSESGSNDETIESLSDEEENAVARMAHFYLQARYEESSVEAERCMNSLYPEIRGFALLVHAVDNVAQNNIEVAQNDFLTLQREVQHPANRRVAALYDLYRFVFSVFFHLGKEIDPIPRESISCCSEGARLFALYSLSYLCYLKQDYAQALGIAGATLVIAGNRHPLVSIYLNLAASMAAINLSRFDRADHFFLNAVQIAKPYGYIQPFIEHHGPLQGLVEKHIRNLYPELYKMISADIVHFRHGWSGIHNPHFSYKVTNLLTPYEYALAMMAARGRTNQQIADYFGTSINTVKARLSIIYRKLGVTKRSELKKHLNR